MNLTGIVVNQNTGAPLPNAQVWEISPDGQNAVIIGTTDYKGGYNVNTASDQSTVNFALDGYTSTAIPVLQAAGSDQVLLPPDGSIIATLKLSGIPSWLWVLVGGVFIFLIGDGTKKKK